MAISDASLRHRAVQIASQLPSDPSDAARVLKYVQEIVDNFIRPGKPTGAKIVSYPALVPISPNLRASASGSPSETPNQSQSVVKPSTA